MARPGDPTLSAFFAAADALFACRPWDLAQDGHVFGIEAPEFGWPKGACAAFIGEVGENPSLMVFPSLDQYVGFLEQTDEAERTEEPPVVDCAVFSINFDPKREAPKEEVRRAKSLGLKPTDPQGFPWIERFAPRNIALDPEEEDYGFAAALLQAAAALFLAHPDLLQREELPEALATEGAFDAAGKRHTVGLTAPHPEAPWRWDESALDYFRWATVDELYEDYLKSTEPPEGRDCAEADVIGAAVEGFFAFKIFHEGLDPLDLAHDDVEEYLLRYLPGVDLPEDEVRVIPDHLAAFLRWLGVEGRLDPELAAILAADADRCRGEFLARMEKKRTHGDAKEDEAPEPAKKWVWQPGDPPPDPAGDCPCGSGKRYKKCCMPR